MNHRQQQQAQQQIAPSGDANDASVNPQLSMNGGPMLPSGVPAHLMGLMANPALAAAAASSAMFPSPAMLSNPNAFFSMPESFANGGVQSQQPNDCNAPAQGQRVVLPNLATSMTNQQTVNNGFDLNLGPAPTMTDNTQMNRTAPQDQGENSSVPVPVPVQVPVPVPVIAQGSAPQVAAQSTNLGAIGPATLPQNGSMPMQVLLPNTNPLQHQLQPQDHQLHQQSEQHHQQQMHQQKQPSQKEDKDRQKGGKEDTKSSTGGRTRRSDLTPEEKAKQNRDRNREHARSTRLRKKAYVQKLKELVEGLHAERTEEVRQRRVAIQHLAEMQNVRRNVVRTFLRFHSNYETDENKWSTILEDAFWFKQPVTPYRSFRRTEIEQECRITRGVDGMIADSASVSVMVEGIGSRSARWMQIKREEFVLSDEAKRGSGSAGMPKTVVRQDSRLQHAISSLSSSSGSSNSSAGEEAERKRKQRQQTKQEGTGDSCGPVAKKVSSSSGSSSDDRRKTQVSKDFHDYHAQPLPDPKLGDSGSSSPSEDSPEESNSNGDTKRVSTDSSSGEDVSDTPRAIKRRKTTEHGPEKPAARLSPRNLPANIAKTGGIAHNILPVHELATRELSKRDATVTENSRLNHAPTIIPPFAGIGKRAASVTVPSSVSGAAQIPPSGTTVNTVSFVRSGGDQSVNGANVVCADVETSSSNSASPPQIRAYYHINEDDMILMDDVLMCPYIFRSQDAVVCGALAECVMPGMFRAHFSARNKLMSVEMVFDAMGFMQQLERASGSENTAQIIPGSLEMALSPSSNEARVITLAEPPFLIVNVNECWTRVTKYTQMEVEGKELLSLLSGEKTVPDAGDRPGKPRHSFEEIAKGRCACSTNIHYDKNGREFADFICSYPLTNASDEITHLLHITKELPALHDSVTT